MHGYVRFIATILLVAFLSACISSEEQRQISPIMYFDMAIHDETGIKTNSKFLNEVAIAQVTTPDPDRFSHFKDALKDWLTDHDYQHSNGNPANFNLYVNIENFAVLEEERKFVLYESMRQK